MRVAILSAVLSTIFYLDKCILFINWRVSGEWTHRAIVDGTAPSPFLYRVLMPFVLEPIGNYAVAYTVGHFVVFLLLFAALHAWLSALHGEQAAMVGQLAVAAVLPAMMEVWGAFIWAPVEMLLLTIGALWLHRYPDRPGVLALLVFVATLNRETGVMLVLVYAALAYPALRRLDRRAWSWLLILALAWAATYLSLRVARGNVPHVRNLTAFWQRNIDHLPETIRANLVMLPFWAAALLGYRHAAPPLHRLMWITVPYLLLIGVFGRWLEIRMQLTVLPILLSSALAYPWRSIVTHHRSLSIPQ